MPNRGVLRADSGNDHEYMTSKTTGRDRVPNMVGPDRPAVIPLVPGLALCGAGVLVAIVVNRLVPTVSALLAAILLGAVLANTVTLPSRMNPGVGFAAKRLLRAGVVLLGLQLVLSDIAGLGAGMMAVVIAVVSLGIGGTLLIGRWLGIGFTQRLLIACGFSICGAAAVAATEGVVEAKDEEVGTSIALVVVFGTAMIPLLPLAVDTLGMSESVGGLWAGASIHEVAQVVAAGGVIGGPALAAAVVVKLARVMMLAPVLATLSWWLRRSSPAAPGSRRPPLIPLFVAGFVAMMLLRSTGVVPTLTLQLAQLAQTTLLAAAMFALGLGIRFSTLRGVGGRPVLLALLSTILVAATGLCGVMLVR
jgi:uncharacterized integral membrane protein (TIGR00698 family)